MKYISFFADGSKDKKALLGGKGANLAEMTRIGLPVPPGFTVTTKACLEYMENGIPNGLEKEIRSAVKKLEKQAGKKFGDPENPLLVSVRSGAAASMPGMMDTVLNLGLNQETVKGLASLTSNTWFAYDAFRRFIMMFADIVFGVSRHDFEEILEKVKKKEKITQDTQVSVEGMQQVVKESIELFKKEVGKFPEDPFEQLMAAVEAVFESWNNPRAVTYRNIHKLPHTMGTAVNVQGMVFGNMGNDSGTGVVFTRNPTNGKKELYGEYLPNAQGEDVVSGSRTPLGINELQKRDPKIYKQLKQTCKMLEDHYKELMDIEFTVEKKKFYMLQCRVGKRTAEAAVRTAVDMVKEKRINKKEALLRVDPHHASFLLHGSFKKVSQEPLGKGLPASPGAASGTVLFSADEAAEIGKNKDVILVRNETTPDDIHGLVAAKGVLTARGGMTSHAAVVARGMGKPCVSGCSQLTIDMQKQTMKLGNKTIKKGEAISIDGTSGEIYSGNLEVQEPKLFQRFKTLLKWADDVRTLKIRTNADTPEDAQRARKFGAEGIGLCRTEHMFMGQDRLPWVQKMILADDHKDREQALKRIEKMQVHDFEGIFTAMNGLPVTIRLLDPPLHEFLPNYEVQLLKVRDLEKSKGKSYEKEKNMLHRIESLREANPMIGLRGVRLGILFPEIYEMQVRAIFTAACRVSKKRKKVLPEIMIPLVGTVEELHRCREMLEETAKKVLEKEKKKVNYLFGTMIELPRAALTADQIAEYAEFFSFGTNDMTQMVFGYSRDDVEGKFLSQYLSDGILKENPFEVLDRDGVGQLMEIAVQKGKSRRKDLKLGICGEHGGDPSSIEFCNKLGVNYVSCSPFRVPIARLAAAHAALGDKSGNASD